tara:strand:- start:195 stop:476 length:282 start_codon:yes stop_codon:yes gene_type:complete
MSRYKSLRRRDPHPTRTHTRLHPYLNFMYAKDRRTDEMISAIREIPPDEARRIYEEINYKKYGVVAGCRTSPKNFRAYLERRAAEDLRAKHGR